MRLRTSAGDQDARRPAAAFPPQRPRVIDPMTAPHSAAEIDLIQRAVGNRATAELVRAHSRPRPSADDQSVIRMPSVQRGPSPTPGTGSAKTPPAPSPPPDYDTDLVTPTPVPAGLTLARMRQLLDALVKKGDITSYAVRRVTPGTTAEIFLLALIFGLARRSQWGTESDIVAPVDWPAKGATAAQQGRITVRFDRHGAASAELVARGPVPPVTGVTFADGVAKLTGPSIGFSSVSGWTGKDPIKDAEEISIVIAALSTLTARSAAGLAALAGVELIRVPTLPGTRAGEFFAGSQVALGDSSDVKPYLKLADLAFAVDRHKFAGDGTQAAPTVPASFQSILHEVGHAVETAPLRAARAALVAAQADADAATQAMSDPDFDKNLAAARRKGKRAVAAFYKKTAAEYKIKQTASDAASKRRDDAAKSLSDTRDATSTNTKRLQKFVDLVTTHKVRPFTDYAAKNWPSHPEEFYAEAYSLWLTDPTFVRTNYKIVFEFFDNGTYLTTWADRRGPGRPRPGRRR